MLCDVFVDECKELFNITNSDEKICAIPNPSSYDDFISEDELEEKNKELLFVGRISEGHKRISYIIKAWNEIEHRDDFSDWKLTIVGDGPDLDIEKDYARQYQCKRIHFKGHQNPLQYYKRSAIFLMTSENEGWGMTLVEAQQNGCVPVVMNSFASVHEIIQNDVNGLIVENDNIQEYVVALASLMSDDAYRLKLARKGLETCRQFAVDRIIKQWEVLFGELVQ
jgi:glycosyltransferase involved in cell wall biosynthesis